MTERAYTVSEIDRMRAAVRINLTWKINDGWSLSSDQERLKVFRIEEELRTYMLAGVSIEDLEREAKAEYDRGWLAARREMNASQEFYQNHDSMGRKLG